MSDPDISLYDRLGGETTIRTLVDRFYDHMDARDDARTIRQMHPADLTSSREHLFLFLTMWTGGPRTYLEQRGHPRMRARHMPFPIDIAARDSWMRCMDLALAETIDDPHVRGGLHDAFLRIADHMRNQPD